MKWDCATPGENFNSGGGGSVSVHRVALPAGSPLMDNYESQYIVKCGHLRQTSNPSNHLNNFCLCIPNPHLL